MATSKNTSTSSTEGTDIQLRRLADELHNYAAVLQGVTDIIELDGGKDQLHVAGFTCDQINAQLCRIGDSIYDLTKEGGAA